MTQLFGAIEISDVSTFNSTEGQQLVYEATLRYLAMVNADMAAAMSVFVQPALTENHVERYQLPGGGRLQKRRNNSPYGAGKASGSWDVAYPLEDFGQQIAGDDVTLSYTTPEEYQRHVQGVIIADQNTLRYEILRALFNNNARTFVDERWGSITIQPLASGDAVVYPPVLGSEAEATENMYLASGYASSAISDTNNPYATAVDKLVGHFGEVTGNSNIVTFINNAQTAKTIALTNFVEIPDQFVRSGTATDIPVGLPMVPGKIIGRMEDGTWVSVWRWIPADYMTTIHLEIEQPLKMRRDPARTGLQSGLQLVAVDREFPFSSAFWRHRFGVGVANRLNGVITNLTASSFSIPAAYQ